MAAGEAPAGAGATAALYLALISMLMWALFRALKGGWQLTFGGVLNSLGNILNYDYRFIHIHFGGPILALNHKVLNALTAAAAGYEQAMGFWFHEFGRVMLWIADLHWKLARDLLHLGSWIVHTYVPTYVHGLTHLVGGQVRTVVKQTTVIERKTIAVARDVVIPHAGELAWIHKHWKALTRLVAAAGAIALFPPTAIPKIWHGIDDLRKWRVHANRRLHKLEVATGAVAFAALMGNAMGIPWRCLRPRGPVGKVAKRLCGISATALNDLLGLIADVVIITEICEVLPYIEQGFNVIAQPLTAMIGEAGAALCGGDFDAPPGLSIPSLSIPALVGAATVEV